MTNTDHTHQIDFEKINKIIRTRYEFDAEAIRNLSEIAVKLQKGNLTIPGDVKITGNLLVDNNIRSNTLNTTDLATVKRLDIIPGNGIWNSHFNYDNKGINYIRGNDTEIKGSTGGAANLHGNINFIGDVDIGSKLTVKGDVNMGSKLTVKGELNVDKSAIIGNAFVGSSPHSGWAQFSHKNLKNDKDGYSILQDGNATYTLVNSKSDVEIRRNNNNQESILKMGRIRPVHTIDDMWSERNHTDFLQKYGNPRGDMFPVIFGKSGNHKKTPGFTAYHKRHDGWKYYHATNLGANVRWGKILDSSNRHTK